MMQMHDLKLPLPQLRPSGRRTVRVGKKGGSAQNASELELLDQAIAETMAQSMRLAEKLGEMYTVFRSESIPCTPGIDSGNSEIMELSKATDRCIDTIYSLEKRRKELLEMIGK